MKTGSLSARKNPGRNSNYESSANVEHQGLFVGSTVLVDDRIPSETPSTLGAECSPSKDPVPKDTSPPQQDSETSGISTLELFCPINPDDIKNRWLNSYVPVPGQKVKEYPASITAFIYRILKSYAAITVHSRGVPPFLHTSQTNPSSTTLQLSTCLTLIRACATLRPGSESTITSVLQQEMTTLYSHHKIYTNSSLLAAFQAYLIYSLVLFFHLNHPTTASFLRQAIMNLQDLACSASQRGLMCTAEQQQHTRPSWAAWVHAEAKRRTLYTMYLFDSILSAHDNLPTFIGRELTGLPAPASQFLWRADTQQEWETAYDHHLADWAPQSGLRIDELWPIPADTTESDLAERRSRVDRWLEGVDEFGTMMYAVTSCTHGG
ncbi:MAG: hypothetical protein Q9227_000168 [Pyrenula ochraceoflavens]